jgi:hypothetical protein
MPSLNKPQSRFIALPQQYRAFVAGFGSGKTWVGCAALCKHSWEWPRVNAGYFAPTYVHIRDIFYPTIEEVAADWGLKTKIHQGNKEVHLFSGKTYRNTILCRSLEKPETIVGFKIGHALVDELDLLTKPKAEMAWRKIIARMRQNEDGLKNGVDVTTTPEGFRFVYNQFLAEVRKKPELESLYGLVQASTYDNAKNLPASYIPSLRASYPPQLIDAYLRGQFTNLLSGAVYPNFDRKLNHTDEFIHKDEPLHIGIDFNVLNMTATVNVVRDGQPRQLEELTGVRDTPTMGRMLKAKYTNLGHPVVLYPDASGQNTSSKNASESDFSILREYGLRIDVSPTNPAVRDRVNAMNAQILNDMGERRFKINTYRCPKTTESFEQQAWDDHGEPDKTTGHDHTMDAQGYFISRRFPIKSASVRRLAVGGGI